MNQKFSQQRKPWFQLPGCLMSHSVLVNSIPYHSRTTIYSQNPKTRPLHPFGNSTILQEKHLRKQNGSLAAEAAVSSSQQQQQQISSPLVAFLPSPDSFSPLSPLSLYFCASSLVPFCLHFFLSLPALPPPLRLARWMKTLKEAEIEKRGGRERRERRRGEGERDRPTLGKAGDAKLA